MGKRGYMPPHIRTWQTQQLLEARCVHPLAQDTLRRLQAMVRAQEDAHAAWIAAREKRLAKAEYR